jgi:hypothetical protein
MDCHGKRQKKKTQKQVAVVVMHYSVLRIVVADCFLYFYRWTTWCSDSSVELLLKFPIIMCAHGWKGCQAGAARIDIYAAPPDSTIQHCNILVQSVPEHKTPHPYRACLAGWWARQATSISKAIIWNPDIDVIINLTKITLSLCLVRQAFQVGLVCHLVH